MQILKKKKKKKGEENRKPIQAEDAFVIISAVLRCHGDENSGKNETSASLGGLFVR